MAILGSNNCMGVGFDLFVGVFRGLCHRATTLGCVQPSFVVSSWASTEPKAWRRVLLEASLESCIYMYLILANCPMRFVSHRILCGDKLNT